MRSKVTVGRLTSVVVALQEGEGLVVLMMSLKSNCWRLDEGIITWAYARGGGGGG